MNIKRLYSVALAAALIMAGVNANAQQKINDKKRLSEENQKLREVIDSLKMELDRCRTELDATDSLAAEMMAAYGESIDMHMISMTVPLPGSLSGWSCPFSWPRMTQNRI